MKEKEGRPSKRAGDKAKGSGHALNGFNPNTGLRDRRYRWDSEYHLALRCPWRRTLRGGGSSFPPERARAQRPSYSSISIKTPVLPQKADSTGDGETESQCEQSLATTADAGELFLVSPGDIVVVSDTGATANLVCSSCLPRHKRIPDRRGIPRVTTYPSKARFRFGDGRLGEIRRAADTSVGAAGNRGKFTALVLEADIPALLRGGASGALGGQLDFFTVR